MSKPPPLTRSALLRLVAEEACRDGVLEEREKRLLEVLVDFLRLERAEALAIVEEARRRYRAGELGEPRAMDERALYRAVLDAVHADGTMDRVEAKMLEAVRRLLSIEPEVHQALFDELGLLARKQPVRPVPPPPPPPAPAPPPPPPGSPLLEELHALFDKAAALPASKLGLPELESVEQPLRAACAALQPALAKHPLPAVEAMQVHGALFRLMARLGCPVPDTRAAGERAKAAHDPFADCTLDGDPVQRLIAQGWLARAANLSEAGKPERARAALIELVRHLDDRWVVTDLRQSIAGFTPPRRELASSSTMTTVGAGSLGTALVVLLSGGAAHLLAAGAFVAAGAGLLTVDRATACFDNDGITLTSLLGSRFISWRGLSTATLGSRERYYRPRHGGSRYLWTDVYIDLVGDDGTTLNLHGRDNDRQGGAWMTTLDQLQAYVQPRLSVRDLARFREHGTLTFGPLTVTREGLRFRRLRGVGPVRDLPWSELQTADFDGLRLRLFARGDIIASFSASSRSLPNLFSLLALLDQHGHAT